jgi:hypothetical protein
MALPFSALALVFRVAMENALQPGLFCDRSATTV